MDSIPLKSSDLLDGLEKMYPQKTVRPGDSLSDIMYQAGKRSVVDKLRAIERNEKDS